MLGKTVYNYTRNTDTTSSSIFYAYYYDAVGNVVAVYNANSVQRGYEKYYFSQDAFGNELAVSPFLSYGPPGTTVAWATARTAGITEHQTGKWIDPFTGLSFFHARWYDPVVGRFVGRDPVMTIGGAVYGISYGNPVKWADPSGMEPIINGCNLCFQRCPIEESSCLCDCSRLKSQLKNAQKNIESALLCFTAGDMNNPACASLHPKPDATCDDRHYSVLGITSQSLKTGKLVPFYNPDESVLHRCGRHCVCAHEAAHVVFGKPIDPLEGALQEALAYIEEERCLQEKLRTEDCY